MRKLIVEAKGLTKKFADQVVVKDVHLEVFQGECFGILGPNGAGKSTLMRMMYGSATTNEGELYVVGLNAKTNIREIKARIGVLPQDEALDREFTVRENLHLYGSYHGVDRDVAVHRTEDLLKLMRLEDLGDQFVNVLSSAMKRRLGMARAMINQPELLLLDEPTAGLDPQARFWVWDFLENVKTEMGTVILGTHFMEEAEKICDRIAIMDRGQVLAVGEPQALIRQHIGVQVVEFQISKHELQYYLARLNAQQFHYQVIGDSQINVHLESSETAQKVISIVQSQKATIRQPTLSDVFLRLAGHHLRDEPL
ncbi:MAG: ABC transporter ATP-binding protein [Pseudobdellovibrionaceae bacterium]